MGRWSVSECPRGQRVGGQLNVHVCPLGVGGWSKKGKNLSTWLLNAPLVVVDFSGLVILAFQKMKTGFFAKDNFTELL